MVLLYRIEFGFQDAGLIGFWRAEQVVDVGVRDEDVDVAVSNLGLVVGVEAIRHSLFFFKIMKRSMSGRYELVYNLKRFMPKSCIIQLIVHDLTQHLPKIHLFGCAIVY
jgi:hypothetical protein